MQSDQNKKVISIKTNSEYKEVKVKKRSEYKRDRNTKAVGVQKRSKHKEVRKKAVGTQKLTEETFMSTLSYAIVGCGVVAKKHLKAALFHKEHLNLQAVVDQNEAAARLLLKNSGLPEKMQKQVRVYRDSDQMLKEVRPELTAITTPSGSHYELACKALTSGSHVLVEKPLTLNLEQARQMLMLAEKQNRKIAVGHIYRFFPLVQALEADLRAGVFGRILYGDVKVRWGHDQAYYDQAGWRGTWQADGGALMNQSIHALDLMTWLLGESVTDVCGMIDRQVHQMQAEDFGMAILKMTGQVYCQLEGTTNTDPDQQEASFYICCSEGEIRGSILAGKPRIMVRNRAGKKKTGAYLKKFVRQTYQQFGLKGFTVLKNPHTALYGDLLEAIRVQREPLANGFSGMKAVEHVLAIYQSAKQKQQIALPVSDFDLSGMNSFF